MKMSWNICTTPISSRHTLGWSQDHPTRPEKLIAPLSYIQGTIWHNTPDISTVLPGTLGPGKSSCSQMGDSAADRSNSGMACVSKVLQPNGCGSKWKTDVGPQMWMSSLVLTIQLLSIIGVPKFWPIPKFLLLMHLDAMSGFGTYMEYGAHCARTEIDRWNAKRFGKTFRAKL